MNQTIPRQTPVPWSIILEVSMAGIRRRFVRSLITMIGVVLAIAFLAFMLVTEAVNAALVGARDDELNILLQKNGVDIFAGGKSDDMIVLLMILTVLTCTIGIINSMLMAVAERVREIGTLKCLGARDQFIVKMYFIESSVQGIAGALLGLIGGVFIALVALTWNYGLQVFRYFPFWGVAQAMVIAFAVGSLMAIVSAIIPARAAARKQPVEALRVEE